MCLNSYKNAELTINLPTPCGLAYPDEVWRGAARAGDLCFIGFGGRYSYATAWTHKRNNNSTPEYRNHMVWPRPKDGTGDPRAKRILEYIAADNLHLAVCMIVRSALCRIVAGILASATTRTQGHLRRDYMRLLQPLGDTAQSNPSSSGSCVCNVR